MGELEDEIINFLARFAMSTRYYNLNFLSGRARPPQAMDPIAEWSTNIGSRILAKHYTKKARDRDVGRAEIIGLILEPVSMVRHSSEDGTELDTVEAASVRIGENQIMQKFGTLYCVKVVRFAFMILYDLEHEAHKARLDDVPSLHEFFFPFMNDDNYLKSRKTFPIRG